MYKFFRNTVLNNLEASYKLIKKSIALKEELTTWARLSRENKLSDIHGKRMMKRAFEIDTLLREIGTEWIFDYEANKKIKSSLNK